MFEDWPEIMNEMNAPRQKPLSVKSKQHAKTAEQGLGKASGQQSWDAIAHCI